MARTLLTALFVSLLSCRLWTVSLGETIIKQMHVIARHGSRKALGKDASNLQENTPASLTPFGERQMYDLGQWITDAYNSTRFFQTYVASQVRLESSALDRTLVSADAFALGAYSYQARDPYEESLLPTMPANIPVYSMQVENDIYLRAHDKCETFHQQLQALYASQDWRDLENAHATLLTRLAQLDSFRDQADESGKIPLTNVWNVYDTIHVAKTECTMSGEGVTPTCQALKEPMDRFALNEEDFQQLELLTSMVEHLRYGPQRAKRWLGGPLLYRIVDRMERNPSGKFFLYSAHYATILGVLSALDKEFPMNQTIPEYASALIILLKQDTVTEQEHVQVVYKADSQLQTSPIVMSFDFCNNEAVCSMEKFAARWKDYSLYEWCKECNNRNADVCLSYWLEETNAENFELDRPLQAGLLVGVILSFFLFILYCFWCSNVKIKWEGNHTQQTQPEDAPPVHENHGDGSLNSDSMSSVGVNDTEQEVAKKELVMA